MEPVSAVTFLINIIVIVVGAVWAVSRINSTTMVLNETIKNLTATVNRLEITIKEIENKNFNHEIRLTKLEASASNS